MNALTANCDSASHPLDWLCLSISTRSCQRPALIQPRRIPGARVLFSEAQ